MALVKTLNLLWTSLAQTETSELIYGINSFSVIFNSRLRLLNSGHVDLQNAHLPEMKKLSNKIFSILIATNNNQIKEFIIKYVVDVLITLISFDLSNRFHVLEENLSDHVNMLLDFLEKPQRNKTVECSALGTLLSTGCYNLKFRTVITSRLKVIYRHPPPVFVTQNVRESLQELLESLKSDQFCRRTSNQMSQLNIKKCDVLSMKKNNFEKNEQSEKIFKEEQSSGLCDLLHFNRSLLTSSSPFEEYETSTEPGYSSLSESLTDSSSLSTSLSSTDSLDTKEIPRYYTYPKQRAIRRSPSPRPMKRLYKRNYQRNPVNNFESNKRVKTDIRRKYNNFSQNTFNKQNFMSSNR